MQPALKSSLLPSETPLEKTEFLFARSYQLEVDSELGVRVCLFFLSLSSISVSCTFPELIPLLFYLFLACLVVFVLF